MKHESRDHIGDYVGELIPRKPEIPVSPPTETTEQERSEAKRKQMLKKEDGWLTKIVKSRLLKPLQVIFLVSRLAACADMSEDKEHDTSSTDGGTNISAGLDSHNVTDMVSSELTQKSFDDSMDGGSMHPESEESDIWTVDSPLEYEGDGYGKLIAEVTEKINSPIESSQIDEDGMREFLDILNKVHMSTKNADGTKTNKEPLFGEEVTNLFFNPGFQEIFKNVMEDSSDDDMSYMKALSVAKGTLYLLQNDLGEDYDASKITDERIKQVSQLAFDQLEKNYRKELLSKKSSIINLTHYDFDGSEVNDLAKKVGIDEKKVKGFKTEKGGTLLQGEEVRSNYLKTLSEAKKGLFTIFLNVHGDRYNDAKDTGKGIIMGDLVNVIGLTEGLSVTITPQEMADAIIKSGNAKNFYIVNNDCSANPFIKELLDILSGSGNMINMAVGVDGDDKKAWSHNGKSGFTMLLDESVNDKNDTTITLGDVVAKKGLLAVREGRNIHVGLNQQDAAKADLYGHNSMVVN